MAHQAVETLVVAVAFRTAYRLEYARLQRLGRDVPSGIAMAAVAYLVAYMLERLLMAFAALCAERVVPGG